MLDNKQMACLLLFATVLIIVPFGCDAKKESVAKMEHTGRTYNLPEIESYIKEALPLLTRDGGPCPLLTMKAVPSDKGGALLIGGEVNSKEEFGWLYWAINNFDDIDFPIQWQIREKGGDIIPADEFTFEWMDLPANLEPVPLRSRDKNNLSG